MELPDLVDRQPERAEVADHLPDDDCPTSRQDCGG